ncbi:hypothetical protein M427DRAFT_62545 [Gonapodya prolifera JEL478]|uniref:F-box domain-containing protein n=1 Tax=Gonapodya prolifera (strain JEL478) TaxID=1344416 RepID=A0A139A1W3_GONPJ|nr:hypothetical protein M427DRAFT_62545 [Gonapodya prolifera JEL478]|eukprot:KXS10353.1 hypothetical protein M427DRAFT_62545 [Gonapodya prolifera JEL478]
MESLPVELLHKIFRLVPPATFYGVITRLSRRLRTASHDAIPGCPVDSLGVCYEVTVMGDDTYSEERASAPSGRIDVITLLGEYRAVKDGAFWATIVIEVSLPALAVTNDQILEELVELNVPHLLERDFPNTEGLIPRLGPSAVTQVDSWGLEDEDLDRGVFRHLIEFVNKYKVPSLHLNGDYRSLLVSLPPDLVCRSVTKLRADEPDDGVDIEDDQHFMEKLVHHFPSAASLQGSAMCIVVDFAEHGLPYSLLLPERDGAHVRSLIFEDPEIEEDSCRLLFFDTPRAFPSMTEIGVLTMFRGSEGWKHILPEEDLPGSPLLIRKFHIDVYTEDLCEPLSLQDIAQCVEELIYLLPCVQNIMLTIGVGESFSTVNMNLLANFLSELITRAPRHCTIHIGTVKEAVAEHTVLFEADKKKQGQIRNFLSSTSNTETWASVLDGWDGTHPVKVLNGRACYGHPDVHFCREATMKRLFGPGR